jgi:pre-60S factor REI1
VPDSEITYGDSTYELVLPSGIRIGHRAHKHIHKQNLAPYLGQNPFKPSAHSSPATAFKPSPHSQVLLSLVPTMQKDKSHARPYHEAGLIPAKGAGFGGNGDVVRARNKGEAKWAGKATREFRELKVTADQAFIRGIKANSQKHVRFFLFLFFSLVGGSEADARSFRSCSTATIFFSRRPSVRCSGPCIVRSVLALPLSLTFSRGT